MAADDASLPEVERSFGFCVLCGGRIDGPRAQITTPSEQHPERTYRFSAHPACVKRAAEPRFAGVKDL